LATRSVGFGSLSANGAGGRGTDGVIECTASAHVLTASVTASWLLRIVSRICPCRSWTTAVGSVIFLSSSDRLVVTIPYRWHVCQPPGWVSLGRSHQAPGRVRGTARLPSAAAR